MSQQATNFFGFLKGFMSIFMTPTHDGERVSSSRVYLAIFLTIAFTVYQSRSEIINFFGAMHKNSSISTYIEQQDREIMKQYDASIVNYSQAIYSIIKPDTVGVYMYKPEDLHHFRELIHFEGILPNGTDIEDFKSIGIDKTSDEYQKHILGLPYFSNEPKQYHIEGVSRYSYTCPIFNRRSMYVGYVGVYWDEDPKIKHTDIKLFSNCTQAARNIGINIK